MKRPFARLIGLVMMAALSQPLAAAPSSLAKVSVKAEAPDAIAAQQKALAEGEAKAFLEVLRARAPQKADVIAAKVTPAQRAQLLKSVSIENENARAGTYEATVTYVFEEAKISALVEEQKGLVAEMGGDGLLILPLYHNGSQLLLWEPENYWRSVLTRQALEKGAGQLVVPFGDGKDSLLAPVATVQGGAKEPLMDVARRYGTRNAAIVTAQLMEKDQRRVAEVRLRRPGQPTSEDVVLTFSAQSSEETSESLLQRAAAETVLKLRALNQQFSLFAPPENQKLKGRVLRAEFPQWQDWQAIRKQLEGLPGVDFVDIGAISADYAQVTLYYRGEESPIQRALMDRGLQVTPTGEFWTLSLR